MQREVARLEESGKSVPFETKFPPISNATALSPHYSMMEIDRFWMHTPYEVAQSMHVDHRMVVDDAQHSGVILSRDTIDSALCEQGSAALRPREDGPDAQASLHELAREAAHHLLGPT